jgi:hypothetical protein
LSGDDLSPSPPPVELRKCLPIRLDGTRTRGLWRDGPATIKAQRGPPSRTWRTFLANHLGQIAAADFFVVPTAACRTLSVVIIHRPRPPARRACGHHRPSDCGVDGPQTPRDLRWNDAPRYLLRDRDAAFHAWATTATVMEIEEIVTASRSTDVTIVL